MRELAKNRKAYHNFEVLEKFEAGIVLVGTEVKSCRAHNISLSDAYVRPLNEELVRIGEEGVSVAKKLRAATEVSDADVLQAQIEADTAKLSLNRAQNRHQSGWRQLAAFVGVSDLAAHDPSSSKGCFFLVAGCFAFRLVRWLEYMSLRASR